MVLGVLHQAVWQDCSSFGNVFLICTLLLSERGEERAAAELCLLPGKEQDSQTANWLLTGACLGKQLLFKQCSLHVIPQPGCVQKRYRPAGATSSFTDQKKKKKALKYSQHPRDALPHGLGWEPAGGPEPPFQMQGYSESLTYKPALIKQHRSSDLRNTSPTASQQSASQQCKCSFSSEGSSVTYLQNHYEHMQ